jgi:hypothetical protein
MVSTAKVSQVLEGVNFPASKQDLIRYAQDRNGPQDVMDALHQIPDQQYYSMAGVWEAIGDIS